MLEKIMTAIADLFCAGLTKIAEWISSSAVVSFTGDYQKLWNISTGVADDIFVPVAALFVVIYFFITITDKVSFEQLSFEQVMKELIKLIAGLYLVTNSCNIMVGCINVGNGLLKQVSNYITSYGVNSALTSIPTADAMGTQFIDIAKAAGGGVLVASLMSIIVIVLLLVLIIEFLIIKVICIIRLLDICMKTAVAPLAICDTFNGNILQSHAMTFIRSFLALCLQGVFIHLTVCFLPLFLNGSFNSLFATGNIFDFMLDMLELLVVGIASVAIVFKSGAAAKEVMGAR